MTITRGAKVCIASLVALAAALALTSGIGGRPPAQDGGRADYAGQRIRFIVPTEAGGGFDTTLRQLQPYLEEQLGATVMVQNLPGAATAIGTNAALHADQNCMTMIFHGVPHLPFSYLTQDVDYGLADLAPVGGVSIEPGVLRVRNDAPWRNFEELIEDARRRPGQIRTSVSVRTSNNYVGMLAIEQAFGVDFNIVSYDGGGPARTALLSGEVDATHAGAFNSLSLDSATRVLTVQQARNRWADITDNAPPTTGPGNVPVTPNSSNYSIWAPATCRHGYPLRYGAMVEALRAAMRDPEYVAALSALGEASKLEYLEPEQLLRVAEASDAEIRGILRRDPTAFTSNP